MELSRAHPGNFSFISRVSRLHRTPPVSITAVLTEEIAMRSRRHTTLLLTGLVVALLISSRDTITQSNTPSDGVTAAQPFTSAAPLTHVAAESPRARFAGIAPAFVRNLG